MGAAFDEETAKQLNTERGEVRAYEKAAKQKNSDKFGSSSSADLTEPSEWPSSSKTDLTPVARS